MKTFNYLKLAFVVSSIATSLMLTGCGSSKSSSTSNNAGVYGPNANGYYGNLYANFSEAGYLGDNFAWNNIRITDTANFKNFVKKVHGVCDQAYNSGGIYSCDAWANAYFRVIYQASGTTNQARIMFMTYPQSYTNGYWYGYQLPSWDQFFMGMMGFPIPQAYGATRNPIALDMQSISLINSSKGFEARTYGAQDTLANKSLIQFMVREGKVLDNDLTYELFFEGKSVASGTLYRCSYPDCR